ncbi:hypothetical protein AURDEDRAFT_164512 [Auricularia subglabra TFB-10046 SS5]|nr:hypothetical protein AURDEDRAFT_164512 [Auricularia subglabra TFB-10046 SS5]
MSSQNIGFGSPARLACPRMQRLVIQAPPHVAQLASAEILEFVAAAPGRVVFPLQALALENTVLRADQHALETYFRTIDRSSAGSWQDVSPQYYLIKPDVNFYFYGG